MDSPDREAQALPPDAPHSARKAWRPPEVVDLPRLTDLTLQTGNPIVGGGGTGNGGSSVF